MNPLKSGIESLALARNIFLTWQNPVSVVQFVTNRCNARCSFCFIDFDASEAFKDELRLDEFEALSKTLGPSLRNVNLTGGEPFLRPDMPEIAKIYFRNTNIESIFISTNGSLPDRIEAFVEEVQRAFPDRKLIFSFSVDALDGKHDEIRNIKGLFGKVLQSYRFVRDYPSPNVMGNLSITISQENCNEAMGIYEALINDYGVKAVTVVLVRNSGVYKTPLEERTRLLTKYRELTERVVKDLRENRIEGYDRTSVQGRMMNRKNELMYEIIAKTYLDNSFVAPCTAGALFGVIMANGDVFPCEVLDKPLGNVRTCDLDFMKLWSSAKAKETRRWIQETKCTCTYECALSFNILASFEYAMPLAAAALFKG